MVNAFLKLFNEVFSKSQYRPVSSHIQLVWVGGFPAHYMGEFHLQLQERCSKIKFIYCLHGNNKSAFSYEVTNLPLSYFLIGRHFQFLQTWQYLECMDPRSILIAGNFPRINLVAAAWAIIHRRDLYYFADTNILDQKNLSRNFLNNFFLKFLLNSSTKILSIGTRNSEFYLKYFDKKKINNILIHCPLPHLNKSFEFVSSANHGGIFNFIYFGRLEDVKGVDRIISAYALLDIKSQQQSRLLIFGDGSVRLSLESQVRELGLLNKIIFFGPVASNLNYSVFEKGNALVMASHDEPWGLVVNEALSSGIPVIGPFWIGSFVDLVIHGYTGLVTIDNSPYEISKAMEILLNEPQIAIDMGRNGRDLVRKNGWTVNESLDGFFKLPALKDIM